MNKLAFLFTFFSLLFVSTSLEAQAAPAKSEGNKVWKTLAKITYKKEYDEMMGFKVDVPVFSPDVKALDGKEVTIKGYIIPVEGYKSHKEFVFSAFPYNMCFFCGGAGPETVMEIAAAEAIKYTTEPITIKGKLALNDSDINRLIYSMTEVVMVRE
ncbi:MAG: hypothetical protein AB8F74_07795 [Saprospiraceae bacterium]